MSKNNNNNTNSSSSFCSASTSCCFSPPYSPKTKENLEHEDSGFLSCWQMDEAGNEKVSMENFALIRVLGKGGELLTEDLEGF